MSNYSALIGQTLSERYRIDQEIGSGGQAVVCAGTDTDSGLIRALKLLPASFNTPPQVIERFKKESLLLTNLPAHDNVVAVFDGGYDAGLRAFYTVIEFIDGGTLGDIIDADRASAPGPRDETELRPAAEDDATNVHVAARRKLCTPALAVAVVRRVAQGLAHAHAHQFVHRDVKPGNILIGRNGSVKLTDFGIAHIAADSGLTMTGTTIGTLHYMSPEQVQGQDLDGRSDIYSLGVVLYESLVGHTPYARAERDLIAYHILRTPPAPPTSVNAALSPALEAVVLRALAKSPAERFQTMAEFDAALAELVSAGEVAGASAQEIAAAIDQVRGRVGLSQMDVGDEADSNQRCNHCGAPLPAAWQSVLRNCPGCAEPLDRPAPRPTDWVRDLIRQGRARTNIHGKVGFELAKYLYTEQLQAPTFQQWQQTAAQTETPLQAGTVVMPAPAPAPPSPDDLVAAARQLMAVADALTDAELTEYNFRLPERREVEALAAYARGQAYQLLARHHTLNGAPPQDSAAATRHYDNAGAALVLAVEQYRRAADAWRRYEAGERYVRIEAYYSDVKQTAQRRGEWAGAAHLLAQGILQFPHDQQAAYALFQRAQEAGQALGDTAGARHDLDVAQRYIGYYETALEQLAGYQQTIAAAQAGARAAIATAHAADAAALAEDRQHVAGWMRARARLTLDFFRQRANLPNQVRRIRQITRAIGYLLAFVLVVAFAGEARHAAYTINNPGPFWPGWPQIVAHYLGYRLNFGNWHHFLVMLAGIDLLIFWPFNLLVRRQLSGPERAAIPTLSALLIPLVDALQRRAAPRPPAEPDKPAPPTIGQRLAGLAFAVAPWAPLALLALGLRAAFDGGWPGNYTWWLFGLLVVPALAGRQVGRALRGRLERLDHLASAEQDAQAALDRSIDTERLRLRAGHRRLTGAVGEAFGQANDVYETNLKAIHGELDVLLARLLHYHTAADFIDLPAMQQTLNDWRAEIDETFLRRMGLKYSQAQVEPVGGHTWRFDRSLDNLAVAPTARQTTVRFVHDQDGHVLWGVNGFQNCRRQRLRPETGGAYAAGAKLALPAGQINFTFETADGRWPGPIYTLWVDDKKSE